MAAVLTAGLGLGVVATTLKIADGTHTVLDTTLSSTTGFLFLLAGAVAHVRRASNPIGPLIALAGLALFAEDLQFADESLTHTVGLALTAASSPVIAHLVIVFPHGRLRSRWERVLVLSAYAVVFGAAVLGLPVNDDPQNLAAVAASPGAEQLVKRLLELVGALIGAGVLVVLLYRWLAGRLPQRRLLSPVVAIAVVGAVSTTVGSALGSAHPFSEPLLDVYRISFCLWPLTFLIGVLRARVGNAEMVRLLLERDGSGLAALVQDDEVWKDSRSIDALDAAAGLVLDNQRLAAELEERFVEVQASRARIVAAADDERRRLERDLHDGAQQRLVSVVLLLRMAGRRLGSDLTPPVMALLTGTIDELQATITELRELARGLRPAILTEAGLMPAVRSLLDRVPLAVDLTGADVPRLSGAVEATAYFVVSEAVTNALKHARAREVRVDIRVEEEGLRVAVHDDGTGTADIDGGSGLHSLRDRVRALGGELTVAGEPGSGTTVSAVIPLDG
ncbi:sensor histidine kinase [Amycolatopsis sp. QT-25]|uniref:sensor histidine kinase n=1 Tax=Amycolatopsis sp. QT-25 TaxID=3034022 RepID=UPI0023EBDF95|nr:sensor histidine kinase [Amycolatopsis sp. QT-25]WET83115.1 sensor histidine kinase [Amycolatopsis sp. QT-25]